MLFKGTAVYADSDGNLLCTANIGNGFDSGFITDIAGLDPNLINSPFGGTDSEFIIKVDIGNKRNIHSLFDRFYQIERLFVRNCKTDDLAACCGKFLGLIYGALDIACGNIEHGLHKDRRVAADICIF